MGRAQMEKGFRNHYAVRKTVKIRCQRCRRVWDTMILCSCGRWHQKHWLKDRPAGRTYAADMPEGMYDLAVKIFGCDPYRCHPRCGRVELLNAGVVHRQLTAAEDGGEILV